MNKIILIAVLLAGCSGPSPFAGNAKELQEKCNGKVSVEVYSGPFGSSISFKCDDVQRIEIE